MACGFSSLAITGTSLLCEAMIRFTSVTSAAVRTNDRATASTPCFRPNSRSLRSFEGNAGEIDAFVFAEQAAVDHVTENVFAADAAHAQFDQAVAEQDAGAKAEFT